MNSKNNNIIDGRAIANDIAGELKIEAEKFYQLKRIKPKLSVIILGEDPASVFYVKMIEKSCQKVGFQFEKNNLKENTAQEDLLKLINLLNDNKDIHGVIVQTPLPKNINQKVIQESLNPDKDVDCFNPINMGKLALGNPDFLPCTPYAVFEILKREKIDLEGKHVVIIGRSSIVGKPLALILLLKDPNANATVTVCHSKTPDISFFTKKADIVIAAAGKAGLIRAGMLNNGTIIIDVGTNEVNGKLVGDVEFEEVAHISKKITPVPGGVGPVTNMMLMGNLLKAAKIQQKILY